MCPSRLSFFVFILGFAHCTVASLECRSEDPNCNTGAAVLMLPSAVLAGCTNQSAQLISLAAEDGTVIDNPPSAVTTGGIVNIGDTASGDTIQLFLSFDITALQGGLLSSATVSVYQSNANANPALIVPFYVDHVDFGTLDTSDHGTTGLAVGFHEINDVSFPSFKTFDVTAQVLADLTVGRPRSQFRIRATTDGGISADSLALHTGDSGTNPAAMNYNGCFL